MYDILSLFLAYIFKSFDETMTQKFNKTSFQWTMKTISQTFLSQVFVGILSCTGVFVYVNLMLLKPRRGTRI